MKNAKVKLAKNILLSNSTKLLKKMKLKTIIIR